MVIHCDDGHILSLFSLYIFYTYIPSFNSTQTTTTTTIEEEVYIVEDDRACLDVEIPSIEVEEAAAGIRSITEVDDQDVAGAPVHLGAEVVVEVEVQLAIDLTSSMINNQSMLALLKPKMMEVEKLGRLNHHRMKK